MKLCAPQGKRTPIEEGNLSLVMCAGKAYTHQEPRNMEEDLPMMTIVWTHLPKPTMQKT